MNACITMSKIKKKSDNKNVDYNSNETYLNNKVTSTVIIRAVSKLDLKL